MKVVISSRSFGKINSDAIDLLKNAGLDPVINPFGRKLSEEEILKLIDNDVVGIIAGTEQITGNILTNAQGLKVISRYGVGMENVDLSIAEKNGILVYNTPDTPAVAVAELTLTLILSLLRKTTKLDRNIRADKWKAEMGNLLTGKTVGILGLGRIGKKLVQLLQPFDVKILVYEKIPDKNFISKYKLKLSNLNDLLTQSDVISLHLPSVKDTENIIGRKELEKMKDSTIIINTARGNLLDEKALFDALKNKKIAGAAVDAFRNEPYKGELIKLDNTILTPHIGTATIETRLDMEKEASTKLIKGLKEKKDIMNKLDLSIDQFQAILFDFDGVLCECMDVKTEAFAQLYEPYGEDIVKKVVRHHIENGGISRYVKIKLYHEEFLNKTVNEEEVEEIAQQFSDLVVKKVIASDWVKGAKEFIEKYYQKIDMFVISGTPVEELKKVVKNRNMEKYFKGVYGSPVRKPEHARRIISEHGYDDKKVIYIGDSLSDMRDAETAKIPFLGRIPPGEEFSFPEKIPTIRNFDEIKN